MANVSKNQFFQVSKAPPQLDQKASSEHELSPREDDFMHIVQQGESQAINRDLLLERHKHFQEGDEWISLKLDDKVFATQRSTLLSCKDSVFNVMFQKNSPFNVSQDLNHPSKPYLIDRSAKYFAPILNYLRTGELVLEKESMVKGVLIEAKFYNLPDLVDELEEMLDSQTRAKCAELSREDLIKALIAAPSGTRLRLQGVNLSGLDLSNLDLSFVNLSRAILTGCNLTGVNLENADLRKCNLERANLTGTHLSKANMKRCKAPHANLDNANLQDCDLSLSDLTSATLRFANLTNSNLSGCMLHNADLTGTNLKKCVLKNAILTGVDRDSTNLPMGGVLY